jgi:hypothetical protein
MRVDGTNHEPPDLCDARTIHVGGEKQQNQASVQQHRLDGVFGAQEALLDE